MSQNPWIEGHVEAEMAFTGDGYSRGRAAKVVRSEYAEPGTDRSVMCDPDIGGCGKQAWYKATIGCWKCPNCGELWFENGERVRAGESGS